MNYFKDLDIANGRPSSPEEIGKAVAASQPVEDVTMIVNAIKVACEGFEEGIQDDDLDDSEDVQRLKKKLHAARAAVADVVNDESYAPATMAAAAKLRSTRGICLYMDSLQWIAGTPIRKADLSPREGAIRAIMFPLLHVGIEFPDLERPDGIAGILRDLGFDVSDEEVIDNYDAVLSSFYALLTSEEDELPLNDDPELEEGDDHDYEVHALANLEYLGG